IPSTCFSLPPAGESWGDGFRHAKRSQCETNSNAFSEVLFMAGKPVKKTATKTAKKASKKSSKKQPKPKLLSGGNPQIAMADGDAAVQAYIKAMPGWKRDVGRRLDAIIVRNAPQVRKAVRWNTPFYGIEGQ